MKKALSLLAIAGIFVFVSCDNKATETTETTETTTVTADPGITVDPDEAILKTDTTYNHPYPTTTPAGTTGGTTTSETTTDGN